MTSEIVVHFTGPGGRFTATVKPGQVKGILLPSAAEASQQSRALAKSRLGLAEPPFRIPEGVTVHDPDGNEVTEPGDVPPIGVCYWVGSELICW